MATLIFDSLSNPNGIAFDNLGNLYLTTLTSVSSFIPGIPPTQTTILKIDPNGNVLGQLPVSSLANPKLEFIPEYNALVSISEDGQFLIIDANTLSLQGGLNLNQLPLDTSNVFDIASNQISDFSGLISSGFSSYGDFDIRVTPNSTQVFVAGLSQAQSFPFVLRLTFTDAGLVEARVLLSSTADAQSIAPQSPRLNRGLAVNSQGTVLTTLPLATSQQPLDFLTAFNADIDLTDGVSGNEFVFVNNQVDVYSNGLTTDAAGNFYISTNSVGSGVLGVAGEGALIVAPPDLSTFIFAQGIGQLGSTFREVAINPMTGVPFVTVQPFDAFPDLSGGDDLLVSFPEVVVQPAVASVVEDPLLMREQITELQEVAPVSMSSVEPTSEIVGSVGIPAMGIAEISDPLSFLPAFASSIVALNQMFIDPLPGLERNQLL